MTARAARSVRVVLDLGRGQQAAPSGALTAPDGRQCRFHGWLELMSLIEHLRND